MLFRSQINNISRTNIPVSELTVALQCGGSDSYSGITANPALGFASDLIIDHGGTTLLSETPEIYGAEHIFCIGPYDFNALSGCNRTLVGSTRLRSIKATPLPSDAELKVIVNLNFTYGVNSNARQSWIKGVSKAVKQSGHDLTISRHVAEPSLRLPWIEQSEPIESLFSHASYFVTRFSTLCYEALLRGVPMIYHNPHNEKAKNFLDPMGAYPVTTNVYELYEELKERPLERLNIRKQAEEFLNNHLHLISEASPAELAADVICSTASS